MPVRWRWPLLKTSSPSISPLHSDGPASRERSVSLHGYGPSRTGLSPWHRFYVDGVVVGEVSNGPPYAVAWVDENPFDPARIMVEAYDTLGERAADSVTLNPLELIEAAEVASVLLEASVEDFDGRSVTGLTKDHFVLTENDIEQPIDQMLVESVRRDVHHSRRP